MIRVRWLLVVPSIVSLTWVTHATFSGMGTCLSATAASPYGILWQLASARDTSPGFVARTALPALAKHNLHGAHQCI